MPRRQKILWKYRLQKLEGKWRVLRLNLLHGWTTEKQRRACFESGFVAVEYATHRPPNPNAHPLLIQAFNEGAEVARWNLQVDADEDYMRDVQDTYDYIQRAELNDIYDECRELGLVGTSGGSN